MLELIHNYDIEIIISFMILGLFGACFCIAQIIYLDIQQMIKNKGGK
jgi:hypothetical protein